MHKHLGPPVFVLIHLLAGAFLCFYFASAIHLNDDFGLLTILVRIAVIAAGATLLYFVALRAVYVSLQAQDSSISIKYSVFGILVFFSYNAQQLRISKTTRSAPFAGEYTVIEIKPISTLNENRHKSITVNKSEFDCVRGICSKARVMVLEDG